MSGTGESKAALIGGTTAASGVLLVVVAALAVLAVKYRSVRRLMNRNKVGVVYAEENARKNAYVTEDDMGTEEKNETTCWTAKTTIGQSKLTALETLVWANFSSERLDSVWQPTIRQDFRPARFLCIHDLLGYAPAFNITLAARVAQRVRWK